MDIKQLYKSDLLNEIFEGIPRRRVAKLAEMDQMSVRRILLSGADVRVSMLHKIVAAANAVREELHLPAIKIAQLFDFDNEIRTRRKINKKRTRRQSEATKVVKSRAAKKAAERLQQSHEIQTVQMQGV